LTRVLLVNPPYSVVSMNMGLLYIGSFLEEKGIDVEIFDYALWVDPITQLKLRLKDVDYVGISCMTAQVKGALKISKIVREYDSSLPLIWGGIHPTLYPVQTCLSESVDYVVAGEGEYTLFELIDALEKGMPLTHIIGVAYKDGDKVKLSSERSFLNLDELPQPHYDLVDIEEYKKQSHEGFFPVHSGRGCPHRCSFCINVAVRKRLWSGKSSNKVLDDIEVLYHKYKIKKIIFNDDNWATSKKRVYEICRGLKERGLVLDFSADIRANYLNDEFLGFLAKHGLIRVGIGAESGSERILKMLNKDLSVDQIVRSARLCQKHQVTPFYSFMIGLPGETWDDIVKTWALIKTIKKVCPIATHTELQLYRPYPGSELFHKAKSLGFHEPQTLEEWTDSFDEFIPPNKLPWISGPDRIQTVRFISWLGRDSMASCMRIKRPREIFMSLLAVDCILRWRHKLFHFTPEFSFIMKMFPHVFEVI